MRFTSLSPDAAACAVFDVVNRAAEPVSERFLRLEPPTEGSCDANDRAACYSGLDEGRLAAGEHLVLSVQPPAGDRYVIVDYFMADGNVAHLYPHRGSDDETIPTKSTAPNWQETSSSSATTARERPTLPCIPFRSRSVMS